MCSDRNRLAPSRRATAGPLLERQIAVAVAGQSDAHPAALDQAVAQLAREGQRQLLLDDRAGHAGRARVVPAVARVDDHDRAPGRPGRLTTTSLTAGAMRTVTLPRRASPICAPGAGSRAPPRRRRRDQQQRRSAPTIVSPAPASLVVVVEPSAIFPFESLNLPVISRHDG